MKYFFSFILLALQVGCSCFSIETGFGMDGKAVGWCEAKKVAYDFCKASQMSEDRRSLIGYQPGGFVLCDQSYQKVEVLK